MTPLEDRVRDAIRAKAAEVPPDAVGVVAALAVVLALTSVIHSGRSANGQPAGLAALPATRWR